ncbi:MAG: DUF6775 family putative metallopeptidase [Halovenus sp.]
MTRNTARDSSSPPADSPGPQPVCPRTTTTGHGRAGHPVPRSDDDLPEELLGARLPEDERGLEHLHVPLLDRVLGTWGDHDGRWHKRVNVLGQPALVSVPGLYEAPAKPDQYYKEQQKQALFGGGGPPPREVLEERVEGGSWSKTTDALKGYILQGFHYLATGEDFCPEEECRLHNPHRQPGVVRAQLQPPEFCDRHAEQYG